MQEEKTEAEVEGDFGVMLSADIGTVKHTFTMPWKDSIHFNKDSREREYKKGGKRGGGRDQQKIYEHNFQKL